MAKQWHPLLAQFLRQDYGDRLIIEEEVPLGEMPLRVDLLLMPRDPAVSLPFPFNHLGATTLVEFKGPDEVITQGDLVKLEVYGLLYQMKERLWAREELVLWLVGSHFASDVSRVEGAEIVEMVEVGPGVRRGKMDKFPTCLVDVTRLPVGKETLPLVMVTKGQREWEVMEYLVEHREEYGGYLTQALLWHFGVLEEVLKMRGLTVDELGLEMEVDVKGIVNFLGPERILQAMAE
ncbi:MAG TPA: hypothetical protein EYP85_09680, partial [Armatimonadetes bacterium]|nr:hypothetical protein [Armatimonadota bacterium]